MRRTRARSSYISATPAVPRRSRHRGHTHFWLCTKVRWNASGANERQALEPRAVPGPYFPRDGFVPTMVARSCSSANAAIISLALAVRTYDALMKKGLGLNPQSQPRRTFPQKRTLQTVTHFPPDDLRITHGITHAPRDFAVSSSVFGSLTATFEVVRNTGNPSSEKAALYR